MYTYYYRNSTASAHTNKMHAHMHACTNRYIQTYKTLSAYKSKLKLMCVFECVSVGSPIT